MPPNGAVTGRLRRGLVVIHVVQVLGRSVVGWRRLARPSASAMESGLRRSSSVVEHGTHNRPDTSAVLFLVKSEHDAVHL